MAILTIEKNGFYNCDGNGSCGGTNFVSKENVIYSFNCDYCNSFQKRGFKIIDKREETKLKRWLK